MRKNEKILKYGFISPLIISIIIGICALYEKEPKVFLPLILFSLIGMYFSFYFVFKGEQIINKTLNN